MLFYDVMKFGSIFSVACLFACLGNASAKLDPLESLRGSSGPAEDRSFHIFNHHRNLQGGPPPVDLEVLVLAISIPTLDPWLAKYETPIALRFTNYFGAMWWNCIAVYSTDYSDTLTKTDPAVRVMVDSLHTKANRIACMAQTIATYNALSLPEALPGYLDVILGNNPLEIDYTGIVQGSPDPHVNGCDGDVACLQALAASESYSPTIMGQIVARLAYDYSLEDGYNQLGTDDGCVVSCRPYKDTTGFTPAVKAKGNYDNSWEPLIEENGKGFFYRQEHVTPHIGETAKFRYLPEEQRETRVAPPPGYSKKRILESLEVIELMLQLNDTTKVEVEVFDDKLIVANAIFNSFIGKLASSGFVDMEFPVTNPQAAFVSLERFVSFISGYLATELDAVVIAWKEKVKYDLIRPTSVIKKFGFTINTWAPGGVQDFPADNFEAYKRVMPHSEYVSGSACLFQAGEDYIVGYMAELGLADPTFPLVFDTFLAGSSSVEPGIVPAQDITLTYDSIEAMSEAGSQSRLNGGMHFEASVPAAKQLCKGIGTYAVTETFALYRSGVTVD